MIPPNGFKDPPIRCEQPVALKTRFWQRGISGADVVSHGVESGQQRRQTEALPSNTHAGNRHDRRRMTCLQSLADLQRLEGPWLEEMLAGDPETVAITLRLLMAHMASMSKRLMGAMVLDRLDAERATASEAVGLFESGPIP